MTLYPPWGVISTTFLILGSYCLINGLDSAAIYLATDSSLRRIISTSPDMGYDILKSLGYSETEHIVTSKVKDISKQVYSEIEADNLFYISSEPANLKEYIDEAILEVWRRDQNLLQKGKDQPSTEAQ